MCYKVEGKVKIRLYFTLKLSEISKEKNKWWKEILAKTKRLCQSCQLTNFYSKSEITWLVDRIKKENIRNQKWSAYICCVEKLV